MTYAFKDPNISTQSKLYKALLRRAELLLTGRVLVLDPSVGSVSSQPGYSIWTAGELEDSGVIDMPTEAKLHRRLFYLRKVLMEEFPGKFDVVVVEDIPTHRFSRGRGRVYANAKAQIPLHKAVGVIEASVDCQVLLHIAPVTWRSYASDEHLADKEDGAHTDALDALVMGHAVLQIARHAAARAAKRRVRSRRSSSGDDNKRVRKPRRKKVPAGSN